MKILAFDSSGMACSAVILRDGEVVSHRFHPLLRGHAEILLPMIRDVLVEAGLAVRELDKIVVTTGPGSFTGIRIGLAAARGFALAGGVALHGVTSFAAVAAAVFGREPANVPLLVALGSRRDFVFVQCFEAAGERIGEPAALAPEAIEGWLPPGAVRIAGDAAMEVAENLRLAGCRKVDVVMAAPPDARHVARLASAGAGLNGPDRMVRPCYLRPPDVTVSPGGPREAV
jgi:tRNA threonylcarbamoyladenosine biosynthesis protein TsaB